MTSATRRKTESVNLRLYSGFAPARCDLVVDDVLSMLHSDSPDTSCVITNQGKQDTPAHAFFRHFCHHSYGDHDDLQNVTSLLTLRWRNVPQTGSSSVSVIAEKVLGAMSDASVLVGGRSVWDEYADFFGVAHGGPQHTPKPVRELSQKILTRLPHALVAKALARSIATLNAYNVTYCVEAGGYDLVKTPAYLRSALRRTGATKTQLIYYAIGAGAFALRTRRQVLQGALGSLVDLKLLGEDVCDLLVDFCLGPWVTPDFDEFMAMSILDFDSEEQYLEEERVLCEIAGQPMERQDYLYEYSGSRFDLASGGVTS